MVKVRMIIPGDRAATTVANRWLEDVDVPNKATRTFIEENAPKQASIERRIAEEQGLIDATISRDTPSGSYQAALKEQQAQRPSTQKYGAALQRQIAKRQSNNQAIARRSTWNVLNTGKPKRQGLGKALETIARRRSLNTIG
ncbi:MAG: hypothetical protein KTR14_02150 [Vampirovibrio sp.]|nr:hypothetical protein [Vampirovibrio sp.]